MIHIWGYRPGIMSLILDVTILSSKCLILRQMKFKLDWAYPWLWFHTVQRESLNYFKQNLCWIICISQLMSHEISQVWILFGGFVVLGWRCHYSTPPGRAGRAGPSATFQSGEHAPWPADKSPASRTGAYQSLDLMILSTSATITLGQASWLHIWFHRRITYNHLIGCWLW